MDYAEAKKTVSALKIRENFLVIELRYDTKLVLPYKDGIAFLASLVNAEQLQDGYQQQHRICGVDPQGLRSWIMSGKQYERYKIAALLNISIADVEKYENPQPQAA